MSFKAMTVYGTRPEAIKVAPVIRAVERASTLRSVTVATGQHREMLDQVNRLFGIVPDHDLDVFSAGQGLNSLVSRILDRFDGVLTDERPDGVLVHGDTSTAVAAALAAFHRGTPVFHLEAGLRSRDTASPFPEEANRRITAQVSALHLAPTPAARANLLLESVPAPSVVVTGNTVIDALLHTAGLDVPIRSRELRKVLGSGRPILLVTTHRRESWGSAMEGIGRALARIARAHPDWELVLPAHSNPVVRRSVLPHIIGMPNVLITDPLPYGEFARVLARSRIVLTDSGGLQEEAPTLGKPVLVMRENTERPEAVRAGAVHLVGTREDTIVGEVHALITDAVRYASMTGAVNPYGDGHAAARVVAAIEQFFGVGARLPEFTGAVADEVPVAVS